MACDYYIFKDLQIYYNDVDYVEIELERLGGYYDDEPKDEDEDKEDYEKRIKEHIKYILISKMKPILIYDNNIFVKPCFEAKYKSMIENMIKNLYDKKWSRVTKIIKVENRRE
jgi:hypothetical protein